MNYEDKYENYQDINNLLNEINEDTMVTDPESGRVIGRRKDFKMSDFDPSNDKFDAKKELEELEDGKEFDGDVSALDDVREDFRSGRYDDEDDDDYYEYPRDRDEDDEDLIEAFFPPPSGGARNVVNHDLPTTHDDKNAPMRTIGDPRSAGGRRKGGKGQKPKKTKKEMQEDLIERYIMEDDDGYETRNDYEDLYNRYFGDEDDDNDYYDDRNALSEEMAEWLLEGVEDDNDDNRDYDKYIYGRRNDYDDDDDDEGVDRYIREFIEDKRRGYNDSEYYYDGERDELEDFLEDDSNRRLRRESAEMEDLLGSEGLSPEFRKRGVELFEKAVRKEAESLNKREINDIIKEVVNEVDEYYLDGLGNNNDEEEELDFNDGYDDLRDGDAVDEEVKNLYEHLEKEVAENVDLTNKNNQLVREKIISEYKDGMSDTDFERFGLLASNVRLMNEDQFRKNLNAIRDSNFKNKGNGLNLKDSKFFPISEEEIENESPNIASDVKLAVHALDLMSNGEDYTT